MFFICLEKKSEKGSERFAAAKASERTAVEFYVQDNPWLPERPFSIPDCGTTPNQLDWARTAALIIGYCLEANGTPAAAMRDQRFRDNICAIFAGKDEERFAEAFSQFKPPKVKIERLQEYALYNRYHVTAWLQYSRTVFNETVTGPIWGLTAESYETMMADLKRAFGKEAVNNFTFLHPLLESYSELSLDEFRDEFSRYSLCNLNLEGTSGELYFNLLRTAYVAGRTNGGPHLLDTLIGLHEYKLVSGLHSEPNIIATPLPFAMFLPIYWYTVRKFLLTNTSS